MCWGDNRFGQFGVAGNADVSGAVVVQGVGGAVEVSAGESHSCAVLEQGGIMCWGSPKFGQLGVPARGSSSLPVLVPLGRATHVAAGRTHTCARLEDGTVWCWGDNTDGQVGSVSIPMKNISPPVAVPGVTDAVSVTAGNEHSCVVLENGQVMCWGDNHFGQLGHGIQSHAFFPPRVAPIASIGALAVTAGRRHTCALLRDRTVQCWGENTDGQLGDGSTKDSRTPVRVSVQAPDVTTRLLDNVIALSAGWHHTCALRSDRQIYCWGSNRAGQLGSEAPEKAMRPVWFGLTNVTVLAAGGEHTCAVSEGAMHCVGRNQAGQ
jgi:alpha-tubulin suppressor-like RCC1 family protein